MPSEDPKRLKFNQYQKSDKVPFIIYADLADYLRTHHYLKKKIIKVT